MTPAVYEFVLLSITSGIAILVARRVFATQDALNLLPIILGGPECKSFEEGQSAMYREVRRARQGERPLSMIAMKIEGTPRRYDLEPLLREAQGTLAKQIRKNRAAQIITQHLNEGDVLATRDDHFVALLVETDELKAKHLAAQVTADLEEEFEEEVRLGYTFFPHEEVTLSGLFEGAEAKLAAFEIEAEHAEEDLSHHEYVTNESEPAPTSFTDS